MQHILRDTAISRRLYARTIHTGTHKDIIEYWYWEMKKCHRTYGKKPKPNIQITI